VTPLRIEQNKVAGCCGLSDGTMLFSSMPRQGHVNALSGHKQPLFKKYFQLRRLTRVEKMHQSSIITQQ